MKRKLACLGLAFALAELFAAYVPSLVLLPAAALLALLLFLYWRRSLRFLFLGALSGVCIFLLYGFLIVKPVQKLAGQQAHCTVVVETDAEASYRDGYLRGTLQVTELDGNQTNFRVNCAAFPAEHPGESFTADFLFQELEDDSYRSYYESSGVYLQAEYQENYVAGQESHATRFVLFRIRSRLAQLLQQWMPSEEGELEAAMLLGHKEALRDSVQDSFRTAGVSHLLAVSGLHVALLCGIFSLGRRRRFLRPLILLRALLVVFYMLLTGLPVSVLRAGLVFLLALAGDFFWQPVDLLTSTGAAAILLGLQNPYAPCDVGFQLSFCAVLGVQMAGALVKWEKCHLPDLKTPLGEQLQKLALYSLESVQVALLASLATLPVLVAHNLSTSGVSLLTNLLVVWMLQPALLLGILILITAALPAFGPMLRMFSLLLSLWLHWMIRIVNWCAALPMAQIDLPKQYTLFVFVVIALLAVAFWYAKRMEWYLPVAAVCLAWAVFLGVVAQRNVVHIAMVGAANNPCVVCTQNGEVCILFRGGQSNLQAIRRYLSEHASPKVVSLVDLRQNPSELDFSDFPVSSVEQSPAYSTQPMLDDLSLDLYHDNSGNLAVVEVGDRHIAVMAGNIQLSQSIQVDVFCAAGALSESVQARRILTCTAAPAWLPKVKGEILLYGSETPVITIRPGHSMSFEEVEPLALQ